ncbi:MAG: hypothetical protein ABS28_06905 [Cryomorphaceae bacterium BACL22 MAG-120619-bin32]|jgi:arylsulfatase A-like enzyme|nr:MAG: hypothetical protein ABS28_06905 [Cryomorphaceae bacterium BACL22 MAG-120619-bin32]
MKYFVVSLITLLCFPCFSQVEKSFKIEKQYLNSRVGVGQEHQMMETLVDVKTCNDKYLSKPNIVILYSDDLGWSDLGCYGSNKNETPHLDSLSKEGITFTQAYAAAPICSASRAALLTGKSPARVHFEFVVNDGRQEGKPLLPPVATQNLKLEEITFAEIARDAGYKTAMFGKWHLSQHNGEYLKWSDTHGPLQQGFSIGDYNYGSHPYNEKNRQLVYLKENEYPQDVLVDQTVEFIRNHKNVKSPFLLYFSSYYVHTPVIPNNSWLIEKYRNKFPKASEDEIKYAAFVETMDYYYGEILDAIKENGLEDNTIVIFTSDNGGHPIYTDNLPLRGHKWNLYEGGIREPLIIKWTGKAEGNTRIDLPVIQWDILPTICDVVNSKVPENVDGTSLLPLLENKELAPRKEKYLYWHFPNYINSKNSKKYEGTTPCSAIRDGDYKLLYFYEEDYCKLYKVNDGSYERNDLIKELPQRAKNMQQELLAILKRVNARLPIRNSNYTNGN